MQFNAPKAARRAAAGIEPPDQSMSGNEPAGHDYQTGQPKDSLQPSVPKEPAGGGVSRLSLLAVGHLQLHSIEQTGAILGVCRTKVYSELKHGLGSVRIGRRRLVPHEAIERYLANLPTGWTK